MVLFGSQLKVPIPMISSSGSLKHHENFGAQTHNSQSCCISPTLSPSSDEKAPKGCHEVLNSPCVYTNQLSMSEMELSEDYTCVISHGPNPRTTHIFDNYIVESCSGFSNSKELVTNHFGYPFHGFLSFFHACKRNIEQGKDLYMYKLPLLTRDKVESESPFNAGGTVESRSVECGKKEDIYQLGAILLEVITSKRITSQSALNALKLKIERSLKGDSNKLRRVTDPTMSGTFAYESVRTATEVAVNCQSKDLSKRPSIEDVLWNLQYSIQVQDGWANSGNLSIHS